MPALLGSPCAWGGGHAAVSESMGTTPIPRCKKIEVTPSPQDTTRSRTLLRHPHMPPI
jgi:hypothetical protein